MNSCLRLLAALCSVLLLLSSTACATTQMPKVYNGGTNNKTIADSPGAKICEGEGACKEETHNHYEGGGTPATSSPWYESGWFWLGLCAVGGLGAAIYYYAAGDSAAATIIVLN